MNEEYVSKPHLTAATLWAVVVVLMFAAWGIILFAESHWRIAGMLAATAMVTCCVAGVLNIKVYAMRQCSLIRLAHGLDSQETAVRQGPRAI